MTSLGRVGALLLVLALFHFVYTYELMYNFTALISQTWRRTPRPYAKLLKSNLPPFLLLCSVSLSSGELVRML